MSNLESVSTNDIFRGALEDAMKASALSPLGDESQALIQSALSKLRVLSARVDTLALFSPNEKFEELFVGHMPYMTVNFVLADLELGARAMEPEDRLERIRRAVVQLKSFLSLLEDYEVVPENDRMLYTQKTTDPASVRATKISQFKKEKELRSKVEEQQKRRGIVNESKGTKDYDLILGLLPQKEAEVEDEEDLRELFASVLRLFYTEAQKHLSNAVREVELLRSAPPRSPVQYSSQGPRPSTSSDETWKLDTPLPLGGPDGKGPLLDQQGKALRPFTILPSQATDRARLRAEVFRPDHRLPTITIDEYLEEERRRGNIITGGGKASEDKPTSKEILQEASEMDGTLVAEEKSEQQRREEEEWALFKEANPKGWGNTMNRG